MLSDLTGQITHGATLNMTVWSYCDQFNLCVLADAVAVPDTWELVGGFRAALDELLAVARAQARSTPSPAPSTTGTPAH